MRTSASTFRRGLMLSACFPMLALQPSAVQADQSVVIDAPTPVNVVNADIAAKIATPDRNLAISVTAAGSVTGGGTIFLFPGGGQGDGSIIFSNAGSIGSDADDVVTDFVGVQLFGNSTLADNSLNATNSGLITNGFRAIGFGGAASFSNSDTIYGGVQVTASGDASVLTTGPGRVATGSVSAQSQTTTTNEVDGDFTTTVQKSGNATVVQSDAGTKDARFTVSASSRGTTDVTVTGVAGNVSSVANAMVTTVAQKFIPPAAGETVTTSDTKTTQTGGEAKLSLGADSDVLSALAQGSSSATVIAAGLIANTVQASTSGSNSASKQTQTQDADSNLTEFTQDNSSSSIGGAATVTLAATADTGSVSASGAGGATVNSDGKVRGGIIVTSSGSDSASSTTWSYAKPGVLTAFETATVSQSTGKIASISTGAGSDVAGFIQASGQGGATVTVAGKAGSGALANSSATKTLNSSYQTSNEDGGLLSAGSMSSTTRIGGAVSATLASTGEVAGGLSANSNAGDATVLVEGKGNSASATSAETHITNETTRTYDGKGLLLTETIVKTGTPSGGKASATVTETGSLASSLSATGHKGATASVAGSVAGAVSAESTAIATNNSSGFTRTLDSKGVETSTLNTVAETSKISGGIATVAVTDKGSAGSVTANGDAGATVSNAGTIANDVNAQANRLITTLFEDSDYQSSVATAESSVSETANSYKFAYTQVGGSVSVTNAASGLIGKDSGSITANGKDGVTIVNDGTVRGTTSATSQGENYAYDQSSSSVSTTIFGTGGDPDVTTTQSRSIAASTQAVAGGNVTGTYAGTNGTLNFTPAANGSVMQVADGASKATVSGGIFGNLTSQAGQRTVFQSSSEWLFDQVLDSDGNGSRSYSQSDSNSDARGAGGSSTIVISGTVGSGNVGGGSVTSLGSEASTVTINGGTVDANVSVNANGVRMNMDKSGTSYAQTWTKNVAATDSLSETGSGSTTTTAGAASATLNGVGKVGGSLTVNGLSGATVTTSAESKVGGNVSASIASTSDSSYTSSRTYSRDSKTGVVASVNSTESKGAPAAVSGNASATVAGTVTGGVSASAQSGTATTVVTGSAGGTASASTGAAMTTNSSKTSFDGKLAASAGTSFGTLQIPTAGSTIPAGGKLEVVNSNSATWVGGKASVEINTTADLQTKGVIGAGSVSASGVGGATADISAGSRVSGGVFASSNFTNSTTASTTTYLPASASSTSVNTQTAVGGSATVTNKGTVGGALSASSVGGASVVNTGKAGSATANALATNRTTETVDSNFTNAALREQRTTVTTTAVGGAASISNAAGALVNGSVLLAGKSGNFTNAGFVTGTTTLGQSVQNATEVTTRTDGSTQYAVTVPTPRFAQTYVVEQNGITRGFNVTGATTNYTNAATGVTEPLRTSDITATINLNNGSVTLGDITGQLDPLTQERLTATTVNLKGSGWLGADVLAATPPAVNLRTPSLVLSTEAREFFGPQAVRVTGVATVQKQDAGTFVIHGRELMRSTTPGLQNSYTMDVGQFTINGGEVQLSHNGTLPTSVFGIRGNVTNNATLVLGRRVPNQRELFGESIVGIGPETIAGITIEQVGNFTQGSSGVIVAAVRPSLVRAGSVSLTPGGSASEPLGPIEGGVSIPYFTTPENLGMASLASRVNVTGNLNLAGNVQAVVTRDSLFRDGDGYTLFTYTGTGAVSATVTPTIASPFVSFSLVNDATAKTVRLTARRSSFTAVATDLNAASAAAALDSAVTDLTARILNDAGGGNGFGTVGELAGAQDLANIVSALDWRLNSTQAAELFQELSSAEIYGSLSAIDQNLVFGQTAAQLGQHLSAGQPLRTRLWLNPVGDFARFRGDTATGASAIRSTAYGMAFGADIAFSNTGAFGFGGSYGEHDVTARTSPESARVRTWTIGAYASQGFGQGYVSGMLAYGFSRFSVERSMTLLSRSMGSDFRGTQFDAALEGGYNFALGGNAVVTPFAEIAVRSWHMNAASEAGSGSGGGGVAVAVDKSSKSVFSPTIGARIGGTFQTASNFAVMPHAKLSYTFQGDIGSDRTVRMLGGGNSFVVEGVDPGGFGTIEAGVETLVQSRFSLFIRGGYRFAGGTDAANVRGGISFNF